MIREAHINKHYNGTATAIIHTDDMALLGCIREWAYKEAKRKARARDDYQDIIDLVNFVQDLELTIHELNGTDDALALAYTE